MSTERNPMGSEITRRLFGILGLGTAGGAALAACQATPDPADDPEGGTDDEQGETGVLNPERVFHGGMPFQAPPAGHFNLAPGLTEQITLSPGVYFNLIMPSGGLWDWAAEEWLYLLADGFEFTENRFVYNLAPDLTWSDGSDLTAEDVAMTSWIRWLMNQQEWPMIAGLETSGDLQVTFELNDPSTMFERRIMKAPILPAAIYGEFGERARQLFEAGEDTDSSAANDLREELVEWRPGDNETEVLVSGPFIYDFGSITDASITLNRNEHGVLADQMHFESLVIYNGETEDITPLVLDGSIDYATHAFPISTQQQWEADGLATKLPGVYNGTAITFSMGSRPEFADARFRHAIAHAFDKEEATVIAMDESGAVPEHVSGLAGLLEEQWLDEETLDELDSFEFDQDRAAELLEDAGWSRSGGRWVTPSGDTAEYQITFQSDQTNRPAIAQYLSQVLTDFGITLELNGIESANFASRLHTGQFDVMTGSWGAGELHPHYAYSAAFVDENEPVSRNHGGRGMDYDLVREVEGFGEVDIQRMVTECGEGLDEGRQRELVNQLALIFNRELPKVPIWERFGNNPAQEGVRVLEFPADDDPIWASAAYSDNPVILTMYRGLLHPA